MLLDDGTASLFQTSPTSPLGHLSSSVNPATIKAANEAVRESTLTPTLKSRGTYAKYIPVQQAMIGEYASMHSNPVADLEI